MASGGNVYSWLPASGLTCMGCANPTASPTITTTYTVTVTDSLGCTGNNTVTISVFSPPLLVANPVKDSVCTGSSDTLSISGAAFYSWRPASGLSCTSCPNPVASPTATTTYTVTGYVIPGCSDSATITVKVFPPPTTVITPPSSSFCNGSSVNLTATGLSSYTWLPAGGLSCTSCANPITLSEPERAFTSVIPMSAGR